MAYRICETWNDEMDRFAAPVEANEICIGGKERNKRQAKRLRARRDATGQTTLQDFVTRHTADAATVYTDEAAAYQGLPQPHGAVRHSAWEYVRGMPHTNGLESHWARFKRGIDRVYHHVSVKRLCCYSAEFKRWHNRRPLDIAHQMALMVQGGDRKALPYAALIAYRFGTAMV